MKRRLAFLMLLLLMVGGTALAADWSSIPSVSATGSSTPIIPLMGYMGATKDVYVDNVARTTRSLYERGGGSWGASSKDTLAPIGMLFTCETKDIRMGFGGSTPTDNTLHVFPAGSSWPALGPNVMSTGIWIAGAATDNVHCAMTPLY